MKTNRDHNPEISILKELEESGKKSKRNICEGCLLYKQFGKKCWFYWENKKFCSQHTSNGND